jgi:hypothetical protein
MVLVHSEHAIDDEEWTSFLKIFSAADFHGLLVWGQGVGPNAKQRTSSRQATEARGKFTPIAILTDSSIARAVVGIQAVFMGNQIKAFPTTDFESAFKQVSITGDDREVARGAIDRLRVQLKTSAS